MTTYINDNDSHLTSDHYYDDYNDEYYGPYAYLQQARMPANEAQDITQSSPIRELSKPTSPPSYKEIKAIIKQAVNDAFRRFDLTHLPRESKSSRQQASMSANNAQDITQSSPVREPPEPTSPPSPEEPLHTSIDVVESSTKPVVESSTNHVVESSTKRESSIVVQNVITTPSSPTCIHTVPTSLTQAKSALNPAPTIRHTPHMRTARFVFDPGGYTRRHPYETNTPYHTNQTPRYQQPRTQPLYQYGRYPPHKPWNHHTYKAPIAIRNEPVDKPRVYNTTTVNAKDIAEDVTYEAYKLYEGMPSQPTEGHKV